MQGQWCYNLLAPTGRPHLVMPNGRAVCMRKQAGPEPEWWPIPDPIAEASKCAWCRREAAAPASEEASA